jgi:hypothetical protein
MRKLLHFGFVLSLITLISNVSMAQWTVMDGSVLFENAALGWVKEFTTPGASDGPNSAYYTIVDDPDIQGNKLIKLDKRTTNSRESWRLDWQVNNDNNALTLVLRMKPTAEILEYATTATTDIRFMWLQFRTGAFRDTWDFNAPNVILSNQSLAQMTYDFSNWTIFRFVMKRDSSFLYINENPTPAFAGLSTLADVDHRFMFGARTNIPAGAYYDWIVWNLEGGYAPGQGPALPATLTGLPGGDPSSNRDMTASEPALFEVYPNPVQSFASIRYTVEQAGQTRLDLYDLTGRLLFNVVDQVHQPGTYETQFDRGSLPAGMYFVRYGSGITTSVMRMIIK